jgi:peptidoglycan/LPS O-acetylase OafA/YrhL
MTRDNSESGGKVERWIAAAIGALFIAIAVFLLVSSPDTPGWGTLLAGAVIGGLGLEAVVSAARNRRCLLSRIGPLP